MTYSKPDPAMFISTTLLNSLNKLDFTGSNIEKKGRFTAFYNELINLAVSLWNRHHITSDRERIKKIITLLPGIYLKAVNRTAHKDHDDFTYRRCLKIAAKSSFEACSDTLIYLQEIDKEMIFASKEINNFLSPNSNI